VDKRVLFWMVVVYLLVSFVPALALPNLVGMGRKGKG
jgi:hypothetical protein